MESEIDFYHVKLRNAILAHQAVHNDLQKDTAKDGSWRRRCRSRRKLYEQEIIKLLRQKQQQKLQQLQQIEPQSQQHQQPGDSNAGNGVFTLTSLQSQSKKNEEVVAVGVGLGAQKSVTKGSLFFSIPKKTDIFYSASSSSSSSHQSRAGPVLVSKKTSSGDGAAQFFIRRQRQPPLLSTLSSTKKRKTTLADGTTTTTTVAVTTDPMLKREMATIPHISSFDRGMYIDDLLEGRRHKIRAMIKREEAALKADLMRIVLGPDWKNLENGKEGGEALEQEQGSSSSPSSSVDSKESPKDPALAASSLHSSSASSPARDASADELNGMLQVDTAENTPLSSACPSPVKTKTMATTFEYDAAKEEFFRGLGLVPRDEYDEIVNRKNPRKRRTTANPHFSSAALEAKRQTKMEIVAERKNRRQQERALKAQGGGTGDFSKLLPQGSTSFGKQAAADQGVVENAGDLLDSQALIPTTSTTTAATSVPAVITKPNGKKPLFSDNKSKSNFKIENKQVFPGLYLVKRITRGNYSCSLCEELVQCTLDTVLVCKRCSVFFHLTCATPSKKRTALGRVGYELACPGCGTASTPSDEEEQAAGENFKKPSNEQNAEDLIHKLYDLRQYIHSLSHANQVLGSLCLQREGEVSQLRLEVDQFERVWSKMEKVLDERLFRQH